MVLQAEFDKAVVYVKQSMKNNSWQLLFAGAVVIGWAGYQGYGWWQKDMAMKAQIAFSDAYEAYQRALNLQFTKDAKAADQKELLEQAEVDFAHASKRFAHASYAPYFKAFAAQIASQQQQADEAIAFMRESVRAMSASNPYRGLYEVSLALRLLDGNEAQVQEGLQSLEAIANTMQHAYQDMALYYLGLWYQAQAQHEKAIAYWQRIADSEQAVAYEQARSPWRVLVEQYLMH